MSLRKRGGGLLSGLYEFPTAAKDRDEKDILAGWGVKGATIVKREKATHIFTHVKWEMECLFVRAEYSPFQQFSLQQIEEEISLPTAFAKAKKMLGEYV